MKLLFFLQPLKGVVDKMRERLSFAVLFSQGAIMVIFAASISIAAGACYILAQQSQTLAKMEKRIERLEVRAKKTQQMRAKAAEFSKRIHEAKENLIIEELSTKELLHKEKERLRILLTTQIVKESRALQARSQKLKENNMLLQQTALAEKGSIQEKIYGLDHPIEIDEEDLTRLLEEIEKPTAHKPQAFFKTLTLQRKKLAEHNEVFECDFTFLQRTLKDKTT